MTHTRKAMLITSIGWAVIIICCVLCHTFYKKGHDNGYMDGFDMASKPLRIMVNAHLLTATFQCGNGAKVEFFEGSDSIYIPENDVQEACDQAVNNGIKIGDKWNTKTGRIE